MDRHNKLLCGLGTGVIIGTAAGLLLAPKTGKEARSMVASRAGDLRHKATHYLGHLRRDKVDGRNGKKRQEGGGRP